MQDNIQHQRAAYIAAMKARVQSMDTEMQKLEGERGEGGFVDLWVLCEGSFLLLIYQSRWPVTSREPSRRAQREWGHSLKSRKIKYLR